MLRGLDLYDCRTTISASALATSHAQDKLATRCSLDLQNMLGKYAAGHCAASSKGVFGTVSFMASRTVVVRTIAPQAVFKLESPAAELW